MPTICTRVPTDLAERVEAAAKADDRSVSWFVRRALEEKLRGTLEEGLQGESGREARSPESGRGLAAPPRASGKRTITPRPKGKK